MSPLEIFSKVSTMLGATVVFLITPILVLTILCLMLDPKGMLKMLLDDDSGLSRRARRKQAKRPLVLTQSKQRWVRAGGCLAGLLMLWWAGMVVELLTQEAFLGGPGQLRFLRSIARSEGGLVDIILLYLAAPFLIVGSVIVPIRIWQTTRNEETIAELEQP